MYIRVGFFYILEGFIGRESKGSLNFPKFCRKTTIIFMVIFIKLYEDIYVALISKSLF
jgi:hypothetical protein